MHQKKEEGVLGLGFENQGQDGGDFPQGKEEWVSATQKQMKRLWRIPCDRHGWQPPRAGVLTPNLNTPLLQSILVTNIGSFSTASRWVTLVLGQCSGETCRATWRSRAEKNKQQPGPKAFPQDHQSDTGEAGSLSPAGGVLAMICT